MSDNGVPVGTMPVPGEDKSPPIEQDEPVSNAVSESEDRSVSAPESSSTDRSGFDEAAAQMVPADETVAEEDSDEAQDTDDASEIMTMEDALQQEYSYVRPQRGDIRQGEILAIRNNRIIVDLGLKREAIVPENDLQRLGPEVIEKLAVGDEVSVYILRPEDRDGSLIVSLNRALQEQDWIEAQKLYDSGEIWEGQVKGYNRGGLIVAYGKLRGFVPASHITGISRKLNPNRLQARLAEMVGKNLHLKVIEVNRQRRRLIFSERMARREWRAQQREKLLEELQEGDRVSGTVSNICDFGAFVDIGGTDGLVHISELSWRRTRHPSEVVAVGDEVDVYVLNVDRERKRIGLSLRLVQQDPWETAEERYEIGELVTGEITNVLDFGAFAALEDGIEGLIHISELAEVPPKHPKEVVSQGMIVPLRVVKIDTEKRRMGLSLKRVSDEERAEWEEERRAAGKPIGMVEPVTPEVEESMESEDEVPLVDEDIPIADDDMDEDLTAEDDSEDL